MSQIFDEMEAASVALDALIAERDRLKAINAELLAALKAMIFACAKRNMASDGGPAGARVPSESEINAARAAIAKAGG